MVHWHKQEVFGKRAQPGRARGRAAALLGQAGASDCLECGM